VKCRPVRDLSAAAFFVAYACGMITRRALLTVATLLKLQPAA
jgi:hypothetical protein